MTLRLTKHFTLHFAHALASYDGPCRHLHGHTYHLAVTVCADDRGEHEDYLLDFHTLKMIVEEAVVAKFDHAVVLGRGNALAAALGQEPNAVILDVEPTTENLLRHFAAVLAPRMPQGVRLYSLRLAETPTSEAELILD